jgi:small subunit ribosomal protein S1
MSWGRVNHPSEMVKLDDEVEIKVLKIDHERERIALGMKQKSASPWENITEKYPISKRVNGEVVNLMSYGAFVKLEDGVEGLVHISEMSWTKRVNHPNEVVKQGDQVEVVVLEIDTEKQTISLGMKQTEVNPWDMVAENYPPGTVIRGKVRNLTNYGAFIELQEGIDGLLHITDMSWTRKITNPNEVVKKGDDVDVVVLNIDKEARRISLGLKQVQDDPWLELSEKYTPGVSAAGRISRVLDRGVVVDLADDLEGFVPISHLGWDNIASPGDLFQEGDDVPLKVISLDQQQRRIVLSLKDHLVELDDEDEMNFRAEVQRRAGERAERAKEQAEAVIEEDPGSRDADDSAFQEIERSLGDA